MTGKAQLGSWAEVQEGQMMEMIFIHERLKFQDGGTGGMVPLVLIQLAQGPGFDPQHHRKLDVVVYYCNTNTLEVQGHPLLCYVVSLNPTWAT